MHIELKHLSYTYRSPFADPLRALEDISLVIESGECIGIVGESGSGKTTLIQHFNGLLLPDEGRLLIDSEDLTDPDFDMTALRRRVGLVFQFPENQIFEETVNADVAFGPKNLGLNREAVLNRVRDSLLLMELDAKSFGERSPFTLSGGEKRRVALAGVLAMEPELLVMDEPTVGLDLRSCKLVENMVSKQKSRGTTVLFISHDMDLVARLAERIIVLHEGCVLFDGTRSALFNDHALLKKAGLVLPSVCDFMMQRKQEGLDVRTDLYSVEAAKTELDRAIRGRSSESDCII
jgi:energy-coupling factor transport system ATP-binding protein